METLKMATAVLCTACIGSELIVQLTRSSWAKQCIKAVAGLYILVVLLQVLPQLKAELHTFSIPDTSPVQLGTLEELIQAEYNARTEPEGGDPPA